MTDKTETGRETTVERWKRELPTTLARLLSPDDDGSHLRATTCGPFSIGWEHGWIKLTGAAAEYLLTLLAASPSPPVASGDVVEELTRPIIGIENRTAQEAFDIMSDRIVRKLWQFTTAVAAAEASLSEARAEIADAVAEWELLPEGRYSPVGIERWLTYNMKPAIDRLRAFLAKPSDKGGA